jgi:hypothetical protein
MLKPGGRLVAANGPRQNDKLKPIVEARGGIWEELPANTFIDAGTSVRTILLMLDSGILVGLGGELATYRSSTI